VSLSFAVSGFTTSLGCVEVVVRAHSGTTYGFLFSPSLCFLGELPSLPLLFEDVERLCGDVAGVV